LYNIWNSDHARHIGKMNGFHSKTIHAILFAKVFLSLFLKLTLLYMLLPTGLCIYLQH
jgi:hypothetical protein